MDTERLIRSLVDNLTPVRPLRRPWRRTAAWAAGAALYLAVLILVMSPRDDLGARMRDSRFVIEQVAALLTVLTAAAAAFASVVPGCRRRMLLLPLAPLTAWLGIVGIGALRDVQLSGQGAVLFQADWHCVATVLAGATVPAVAMALMLRRGVPLTPHVTAGLGGLAAAGLGNLGVCLFHPDSSNVVVLVWHSGTVLLLAALAAWAGAHVLRWPPPARMPDLI
jgi:hypothetical protein